MMALEVVEKYREKYKDLSGPERAFRITNAVALELKGSWGILKKSGGMNFEGYKLDVIMSTRTREFVDILGDAEGACIPTWQVREASVEELANWAPPIPNTPEIPPTPPTPSEEPSIIEVFNLCLKIKAKLDEHFK